MRTPKLRVLHCPTNIANSHWWLSRAERKLGLASDVVCFQRPHPGIKYDRSLDIKDSLVLPYEFKRFSFLKYALKNYDVFHFSYGMTILDHAYPGLSYLDLKILKKHGKKIIMTYHGDDARQKDYFLRNYGLGHYATAQYTFFDKINDNLKRKRISTIAQYADAIFSFNPDLLNILPKGSKFLPYPAAEIQPDGLKTLNAKIKIVHAPSDRLIKGTGFIIKTLEELKTKYPIEIVLVEHVPAGEALRIYGHSDICIDQLKVGWYGGFAVEAMALGKPVLSYLRMSDVKKFVPFWKEIPIINSDENNLKTNLERLIKDRMLRRQIGRQSRRFVEKNHNSLKIARELLKYYL